MEQKRQYHRWNQVELSIIKKSVEIHGFAEGNRIASKLLGVTLKSCMNQCRLHKYTSTKTIAENNFESTITAVPENVVETENKKQRKKRCHLSKEQEIELAKFLKETISENPENLRKAFKKAAKVFGVNERTISNRWYGVKTKKTNYSKYPACRKNMDVVYATVGNNTIINGKNSDCTMKKTTWIMTIIKRMFNKNRKA